MDFRDILDAWEKEQNHKKKRNSMSELLNDYMPGSQDCREKDTPAAEDLKKARRKKLLALAPQREIDLHGCTVQEALQKLDLFLKTCKKDKLKKILIIHGKGHHSQSGPILQKRVIQFIQTCHLTGEYGFASRKQGGRGALWVILR